MILRLLLITITVLLASCATTQKATLAKQELSKSSNWHSLHYITKVSMPLKRMALCGSLER